MKHKKLTICLVVMAIAASGVLAGCSSNKNKGDGNQSANSFDTSKKIVVVSREDGSGTRGAFIELLGIEQKGEGGTKKDRTTKNAEIASKTDVMLTNISTNAYAIGYVSMGSLNSNIKALKVDSVEATPENIKNKSYKLARPFNIATKGDATGLTKDFIDFILSKEGQEVVSGGYIKVNDAAPAYAGTKPTGKIVVGGSSSVTPIMEKLREAYLKINTNAEIEIQQSDSTAGMTAVMNGTYQIGMASRDLKTAEKEQLTSIEIALDGIAVIVNPKNTLDDIKADAIAQIFMGNTATWADVAK